MSNANPVSACGRRHGSAKYNKKHGYSQEKRRVRRTGRKWNSRRK